MDVLSRTSKSRPVSEEPSTPFNGDGGLDLGLSFDLDLETPGLDMPARRSPSRACKCNMPPLTGS